MSLAWAAYRIVAPFLGAVAPAARVFSSPHERPLWNERMGQVGLAGGCDAWVHAASLGEANAVAPLAAELAARRVGTRLYLTATTRTGRARLQRLGWPVSLAPIDSPQAVARFFRGVAPRRLFVVETELWPHWLMRARALRVPVALLSARLSERSVGRYRALGPGLRRLVGGIEAVLCQSIEDERRWVSLGARPDRTLVTGNLKNDALPTPCADRAAARAAEGLDPLRPLLVLGSLRPGEVRILARAWRALPPELREHWQVVAVPRHPRASTELREEATRHGVAVTREPVPHHGAWRWDDRLGVLMAYYHGADVAFVGGSLAPYGGHSPLEPAACGAAVVVGPHHAAQWDAVRALRERAAVWVATGGQDLTLALRVLLSDERARVARASAALAVVASQRGAARRAVDRLEGWGLWPAS